MTVAPGYIYIRDVASCTGPLSSIISTKPSIEMAHENVTKEVEEDVVIMTTEEEEKDGVASVRVAVIGCGWWAQGESGRILWLTNSTPM